MDGELDRELKYYHQISNELVGKAKGEYVLIHGEEMVGIFRSKIDAIRKGYELFGNKPFLVKKIVEIEEAIHFTSNLLIPA